MPKVKPFCCLKTTVQTFDFYHFFINTSGIDLALYYIPQALVVFFIILTNTITEDGKGQPLSKLNAIK